MKAPIPIFRMFDVAKAKEFYLDFLGFKLDWVHKFSPSAPSYMQVSRENCLIHLSEHFGDSSPGAAVRIETPDIVAYQKQLIEKKYKNAGPGLESRPWAEFEMSITDPFYNRLIFYYTHEE